MSSSDLIKIIELIFYTGVSLILTYLIIITLYYFYAKSKNLVKPNLFLHFLMAIALLIVLNFAPGLLILVNIIKL